MMTDRSAHAEAYFKQGYNCAQSVAAVFAQDMELDVPTAMKMTAGFGGGFGRLREVCGAFSGIVFVAGALYGNTDPAGKAAFYVEIQDLAEQFRTQSGKDTVICRELLDLHKTEGTPQPQPRTEEYYHSRPCLALVTMAVQIMEEYMTAHPLPR